ncbi:MAG: ArsR/SmtB family transcription factor [Longimicrobiales bacterium]
MDSFAALADPTRREILEALGSGEHAAGEIGEYFAMTAPAISQHLKVLREVGLVRVRAEGQHRIYSLDPAGLEEIDEWLEGVRRFWTEKLDVLERELGKPEKRRKRRRS